MIDDSRIEILISRFISGESSPEEAMALENWAELSPDNRSYLNNCVKLFPMISGISKNDLSKDRVWRDILTAITSDPLSKKGKLINWKLINIAAFILIVITVGLLVMSMPGKSAKGMLYATQSIARTIELKDGSSVTISPGSSIIVDGGYGTSNRKIKLIGSAYFSVVHDRSQSLIIDLGFLSIKDLGTKFCVINHSSSDTILIRVIEGRIAVFDKFGSSRELDQGKEIRYVKSKKMLTAPAVSADIADSTVLPVKAIPKKIAITRQNTQNDSSVVPAKPARPTINRKPATSASTTRPVSPALTTQSTSGEYPYPSYQSQYPPQHGYSPDERRALLRQDSIQTRRILMDMEKDGLIKGDTAHSFKLSDAEFIINRQKQNDQIFQRYKKKYMPPGKENTNWTWSHNLSVLPPAFIKQR